jgi:dTMP kinase
MALERGVHFAFTGIDGAGKSTQAGLLAKYIRDSLGPTYLSEPRTDLISQLQINLAWQHGHTGRREYFGDYAVDFAKAFDVVRDHFGTVAPLLIGGMHVIEPRSPYCRLATSIGMSGKRDKRIEQVLGLIPKPDLLFWIDIDPYVAFQRITARGIDTEDISFLEVFSGVLRSMPEAKDWIRITGNREVEEISHEIAEHVTEFFKRKRPPVYILENEHPQHT